MHADGYTDLLNGRVGFTDLGRFKAGFFGTDPLLDLDGDGIVGFTDLGIVKAFFFGPPGPSGLAQ